MIQYPKGYRQFVIDPMSKILNMSLDDNWKFCVDSLQVGLKENWPTVLFFMDIEPVSKTIFSGDTAKI